MAAVRIPPTLRAEVGGARELEADGDTVAEVIDDLVVATRRSAHSSCTTGSSLRS